MKFNDILVIVFHHSLSIIVYLFLFGQHRFLCGIHDLSIACHMHKLFEINNTMYMHVYLPIYSPKNKLHSS